MTFDYTVSVGDIIAFGAMIVSIVFGIIAISKSKKAKASEEKAAEYARIANDTNVVIKEYYEKINPMIEKEAVQKEYHDLKEQIYKYICRVRLTNTKSVADEFKIDGNRAFSILEELVVVDGMISSKGFIDISEIDTLIWIAKG